MSGHAVAERIGRDHSAELDRLLDGDGTEAQRASALTTLLTLAYEEGYRAGIGKGAREIVKDIASRRVDHAG